MTHLDLSKQVSFVHRQYCVVERNVGQTLFAYWGVLHELLKFLDHQIDDLLLFFIDQEMAHDCVVLVLKLEEDVGEGHVRPA